MTKATVPYVPWSPNGLLHLPLHVAESEYGTAGMVDSGAEITVCSEEFATRMGLSIEQANQTRLRMADGSRAKCSGFVTFQAETRRHTNLETGRQHGQIVKLRDVSAVVVPKLDHDLILGLDFLADVDPIISFRSRRCTIHADAAATVRALHERHVSDFSVCAGKMDKPEPSTDPRVKNLLERYAKIFVKWESLPPRRGQWDFVIKFTEEPRPFHCNPRRYSPREMEAIRAELDKLLQRDWIVISHSPWASPILFAKSERKDGELRAVYDLRELNSQTERNSYRIPRIPDLLDRMARAKYFSRLDLSKAFNQIRMAPESQETTAIATPFGLYESRVMLLGLKNSGPHFQSFLEAVLAGDKSALPEGTVIDAQLENLKPIVQLYLDDLIIATEDMEDHYIALEKVLERFMLYDLRCNEFAEFAVSETEFVGFIVGNGRIHPLEKKVKAILEYGEPRNAKEVRGFLGMLGYYRDYIPHLADDAAHLTKLTRKGAEFDFHEARPHFENLRKKLSEVAALALPDMTLPFVIATDASSVGVGGVLMQPGPQGSLRPLAFYSRQMRGAELKYPIYEQELLAIKESLMHWRCYVDGNAVTVFTDHQPLVTGQIFKRHSEHHYSKRVAGWLEKLWDLEIDLRYHKCTTDLAAVPDALSRRPDYVEIAVNATQMEVEPDSDLAKLRELKATMAPEDTYIVSDGLWYYRSRLVIPSGADEIKKKILNAAHATLSAGHRGMDATYHHVARRFFWPNLMADVRKFVRSCPVCARAKPRNQKAPGLLNPLPYPDGPFQSLEMDFIIGLPDIDGKTSILSIVDRYTKRVFLVPVSDTITAAETAKLYFDRIWRHIGVPKTMITDRDPKFVAKFWTQLMSELGIQAELAAAYHHRTSGQVERTNRVVEEVLRCYAREASEDWPRMMPAVEFAINSAKSPTTGLTPFFASYGTELRAGTFMDNDGYALLPDEPLAVAAWLERLRDIRALVREKVNIAQQRQSDYFNKGRMNQSFDIGDQVFLSSENIKLEGNAKLKPRWIGPFPVTAKINDSTYALELPGRLSQSNLSNAFHTDLLKPYVEDENARDLPPPPVVDVDEDDRYAVERIIDHKPKKGAVKHFLVRWVGYGPEHDEWLPIKTAKEDIPDLVNYYLRARRTKRV